MAVAKFKGTDGQWHPFLQAGKTPEKGVDYFTPEEINSVAEEAAKKVNATSNFVTENQLITVGETGNFKTLNEALTEISKRIPVYKSAGIKCEVKILSNTIIKEQVSVVQKDLSFVTITSEQQPVLVDATGWTTNGLDAHDLRSDIAFIGGENNAVLPTIGTLFKLSVQGPSPVVGYFANRGSKGLVLANCGFEYFNDGVIANNESSVTIREGIARHCTRWGLHARHNGEISARSADLTYSGDIAAYADRIADIDARYAKTDFSSKSLYSNNSSRINANGATANNCGNEANHSAIVQAATGSLINADKMSLLQAKGPVCAVREGSFLIATSIQFTEETQQTLNQTPNIIDRHGIIFTGYMNEGRSAQIVIPGNGWSGNRCTVTNDVFKGHGGVDYLISPHPVDVEIYSKCGIYCESIDVGTAVFKAVKEMPSIDLTVNVRRMTSL